MPRVHPPGVNAEDADSRWDGRKKKKGKQGKEEYRVLLANCLQHGPLTRS
jgi:hypothetical protein